MPEQKWSKPSSVGAKVTMKIKMKKVLKHGIYTWSLMGCLINGKPVDINQSQYHLFNAVELYIAVGISKFIYYINKYRPISTTLEDSIVFVIYQLIFHICEGPGFKYSKGVNIHSFALQIPVQS